MRSAPDLEDYLRDSAEAYAVQRNFCAFHVGGLFGVTVWGRPTVADAEKIVHARKAELAPGGERHALLLDYRLVEVIDPDAFACVGAWVGKHRAELAATTARAALVKPADPFAAATVAGFYSVVEAPYPSQLCATIEEAEAWLAVPVVAPVAAVHAASAAGRPVTAALAQLLERSPTLGMDEAARALGYARRTLQRRLRGEATSFLDESRRARVRRAKFLLRSTDDKIAAIADAVGCSTAQHFCELFRAETGVAPTEWRDQYAKKPS
jgi:AraC-like DNA-binding protein